MDSLNLGDAWLPPAKGPASCEGAVASPGSDLIDTTLRASWRRLRPRYLAKELHPIPTSRKRSRQGIHPRSIRREARHASRALLKGMDYLKSSWFTPYIRMSSRYRSRPVLTKNVRVVTR